jgi:hypothetical protein
LIRPVRETPPGQDDNQYGKNGEWDEIGQVPATVVDGRLPALPDVMAVTT